MCDSQTLFQLKWDDGQRCSEADPMGSVIRGAWQRGGGMPEMRHFASYATQVVEEVSRERVSRSTGGKPQAKSLTESEDISGTRRTHC